MDSAVEDAVFIGEHGWMRGFGTVWVEKVKQHAFGAISSILRAGCFGQRHVLCEKVFGCVSMKKCLYMRFDDKSLSACHKSGLKAVYRVAKTRVWVIFLNLCVG